MINLLSHEGQAREVQFDANQSIVSSVMDYVEVSRKHAVDASDIYAPLARSWKSSQRCTVGNCTDEREVSQLAQMHGLA